MATSRSAMGRLLSAIHLRPRRPRPAKRRADGGGTLIDPKAKADASAAAVAAAVNDFSFRFAGRLHADAPDSNLVTSPVSAWLPLAALANAASACVVDDLLEALGVAGATREQVDTAAARMLHGLTADATALSIADAAFVDHRRTLAMPFVRTFRDRYFGEAFEVDFSAPDAAGAVNAWAAESTDGRITDLVERIDADVVAAIANAVFFTDPWKSQFDTHLTEAGTFHAPSGDVEVPLMTRHVSDVPYHETEHLQMVSLPFENGAELHVILHRSGGTLDLLAHFDGERFRQLLADRTPRRGRVVLPRFTLTPDTADLKAPLTDLGVPLFVDKDDVLPGLLDDDEPTWLSEATQRAMLEIDENGATAAAVTVMMVARGGPPPEPPEDTPFEMVCDRPFVAILTHPTVDCAHQILFVAVVNEPAGPRPRQ